MARKSSSASPPPADGQPQSQPDLADVESLVDRAQDEVAEVMGDIAEFWGFTRTMGRIFGFVYMSPEPVEQANVRTRLAISAGSASTTMAALLDWGVLHREGRLYVAETNFFKLITAVLRQREAARVDAGIDRAKAVLALLRQGPDDDPRIAFARARAEHMLGFFEMGRSFLEAFVDRSPIRAILNGLARTASRLRPTALAHLPHLPPRSGDFDITLDESDDDQDHHERIDA